jgi:uncharacterized protein (TIGR04255 family)
MLIAVCFIKEISMESKIGVRYKNPPLAEALCEFRFQETGIPSNIVLGKLYEQIEKEYPTVETHRGIDVQAEEETASPAIIMEERTRFVSRDGTRLIQVGPGLLVANQVKLYKDYYSFRDFIKKAVDVYFKVAKPSGLRYIGLRYINHIQMSPNQTLEEVFNIGFKIPGMFKTFPDSYLLRMEFPYRDSQDRLIVILDSAPNSDGSPNIIILDFEYILVHPEDIGDKFLECMDEAHERIEEAFHACLTESTLNTFQPIIL